MEVTLSCDHPKELTLLYLDDDSLAYIISLLDLHSYQNILISCKRLFRVGFKSQIWVTFLKVKVIYLLRLSLLDGCYKEAFSLEPFWSLLGIKDVCPWNIKGPDWPKPCIVNFKKQCSFINPDNLSIIFDKFGSVVGKMCCMITDYSIFKGKPTKLHLMRVVTTSFICLRFPNKKSIAIHHLLTFNVSLQMYDIVIRAYGFGIKDVLVFQNLYSNLQKPTENCRESHIKALRQLSDILQHLLGQTIPAISLEFIIWFVMVDWTDNEIFNENFVINNPEFNLNFKEQNDMSSRVNDTKLNDLYFCYYQANKFLKNQMTWVRLATKLHLIDEHKLKVLIWGLAILSLKVKRTEDFELLLYNVVKRASITANVFKLFKDSELIARLMSYVSYQKLTNLDTHFRKCSIRMTLSKGIVIEATRSSTPFDEFSHDDIIYFSLSNSDEIVTLTAAEICMNRVTQLDKIKSLLQDTIDQHYQSKKKKSPALTNILVALFFISSLIEHSDDPLKIALVPSL